LPLHDNPEPAPQLSPKPVVNSHDTRAEPTDEEGVLRPMAHRYFGAELGDLYVESSKGGSSLT
jgi:hypothetical protein